MQKTPQNKTIQWLLLITFLLFIQGCSESKLPHEEGYKPMVKILKYSEVGECSDEKGTLARVAYTGFNTLSIWTMFIHFIVPEMSTYCIPELDEKKRLQLSSAEKQKLDVGFFNKNSASTLIREKDEEGNIRYKRLALLQLQELVRQGSELAYIDLHLFDYKDTGREFKYSEDNPHYQRLKQLAQSGDAEAMCLYARRIPLEMDKKLVYNEEEYYKNKDTYFSGLKLRQYKYGPDDKWLKGVINAAKAGSVGCMSSYGSVLLNGSPPLIKQDIDKGMKYLLKAAQKGSARAPKTLFLEYLTGFNQPKLKGDTYKPPKPPPLEYDLGKYKCWAQVYNQTFPAVYQPARYEQKVADHKSRHQINHITEYNPLTFCQTIKE